VTKRITFMSNYRKHVFGKVLMHHVRILLGEFNAKVWRDGIFELTVWDESLHA
jgi:hypothetical protein